MKRLILTAAAFCLVTPTGFADELPWWIGERKIQGENNLEVIAEAEGSEAYEYAKIVARVEWAHNGKGFCTGSRIGPDLFLTNFHCHEVAECDDLQFTLGYQDDVSEDRRQTFRCKELLAKEESLDFALYRVDEGTELPADQEDYPIGILYEGEIFDGQELIVAGHPSTRPKEIDRSAECLIKSATVGRESGRNTIYHMCDTEGGSSGSPVLDRATGWILALHWGGRYDQHNMAVPMYLILKHLRENNPDVVRELQIVGLR